MNNQGEYIKQLEDVITRFLEPVKEIPFPIVIKVLTGCKVLAFDSKKDEELLKRLSKAAESACKNAFQEGIFTARPNEAGNRIEPYVVEALKSVGLEAGKPTSKSGKKKLAGYPDIQIDDELGRRIYLECKTYSAGTKEQSFRTFYFSPSKDPKITKDAFHLLISFKLDTGERKSRRAFIPISWQIYDLYKLRIQVKHEFNASNRDLYTKEALLAEGIIE
jgi:hypothetical protein